MTHHVAYDPLETIHWMLAEQAREVDAETTVGPTGKAKKKTKAQREADAVRFATLCEIVSNVSGRALSVEEVAAQARNSA
jgi:hypothetical protein